MVMKKICPLVLLIALSAGVNGQQRGPRNAGGPSGATPAPVAAPASAATPAKVEKPTATDIPFNPESTVVTNHEVTIKGQRVPYKATAGTQPVWDEDGKTIAGLFYTYYERSDVRDRATRPLVVSFNGGPGTASVWMHPASPERVISLTPDIFLPRSKT